MISLTTESAESTNAASQRPHLGGYLLLALPPAICYGVMHVVRLVPAGPGWMTLQLLMVSVIPLGLAAGSAVGITALLSKGSPVRAVVLTITQFALLIFVWQQAYQVLVTSWR